LSNLRVLIAGGGTGGHIIPALAVARELVARYAAEVLFVGTARGMESRLVPEAGFKLRLVEVGQLNNVSLVTRLRTLIRLPGSIHACRRLIREFQPSVVFGVGGYASGPAMAAALQLRIPAMVFEPNAVPGLANRLVGKRVQAAAVNFASAARWFRSAEVTGIPVRPEFFALTEPAAPHLLVFGGSQGARIFNLRRDSRFSTRAASATLSPLRQPMRPAAPIRGAGRSGLFSTICPPALPAPAW
jgi:UDP-N-acetylglucosamine--N-acetylmuramyl-(pentapeptide) pyrophosphoryl-undecaprenol N-acetylglucosamine transferase